ncbi:EF-hand domain-containing protein [Phaeovulum sp. W22_SRMD_FR3]|uniref:EF-hand domain-containing protein n=1 Tax=Phaeovulum sp. W22_SRMD_FR3 TaxID=3240274 RepID=UPI003F961E5F
MNRKTTITAALLLATCAGFAVPSFAQESAPAPEAAQPGDGPMGMMPDFATLDFNGDGKLTVEDITAKRAARAAALDADKDGLISVEELVAQRMQDMQARVEARAKAQVAALDLDGDGKLSAAELAAGPAMGSRGGHRGMMTGEGPAGGAERMIARFDTDKDGAVSAAEFEAGKAQFAQMMQERMERGGARGGEGHHMKRDGWEHGRGHDRDGKGHHMRMKPPVPPQDMPSDDAAPAGN